MHRGREGILIGAVAGLVLVALLVLQSVSGMGLINSRTVTTTTTTTVVTQQNTALWQVLKDNLTINGYPACVAISAGGMGGCPTSSTTTPTNETLANVELVSYRGNPYYSATFIISFNPANYPGAVSLPPNFAQTYWFTNSTVFCAKPPIDSPDVIYPVCP